MCLFAVDVWKVTPNFLKGLHLQFSLLVQIMSSFNWFYGLNSRCDIVKWPCRLFLLLASKKSSAFQKPADFYIWTEYAPILERLKQYLTVCMETKVYFLKMSKNRGVFRRNICHLAIIFHNKMYLIDVKWQAPHCL